MRCRIRDGKIQRLSFVPGVIDGHGPPLAIRQHAVDDNRPAGVAVAVMPVPRQGTGLAFVVAAADVIEGHAVVVQMARGELLLNGRLPRQEPVERGIHLVDIGVLHAQCLAQRGRVPQPRRGEFRAGLNQPFDEEGDHEIARARSFRRDHRVQLEATDHLQGGLDMAVRDGALDGEQRVGRDERFVPQHAPQLLHLVSGSVRQIGERALEGRRALAPALTQQNRRRRAAVGHRVDKHGRATVPRQARQYKPTPHRPLTSRVPYMDTSGGLTKRDE